MDNKWWQAIDFNKETCQWLIWELTQKASINWLTPAEERALATANLWMITDITILQVLKIMQDWWNAYVDKVQ